ncbi:GntR family transcriptional regulator [Desulfoferrobacter suflitae]|uniref:GntR family transcriptional regulator n=1 Tax=Desulfoferrobacter suflitae TaxID=2865782 RepID=UPI002164849D|nr:GntR family transcriptional regulator [Desulfoferrobacter suflitae]MCK8600354.1 GntR family transcriptional regulator [Desulfoferrobacter suflitae]
MAKFTKSTYKDQVIAFIYDTILKGRLNPGERISETWLAEQLKISRAPIREALRQLAQNGLVEYRPQVGNFIASLSARQIYDAYVTRGLLEGFAASYAVQSFEESDLAKLEKLVTKMYEAARQKQHYQLANIDNQFHEIIFSKCQNAQLIAFAKNLTLLLHLIFCKHWTKVYEPEQVRQRHQVIVDQLRGGDPQGIEQCIRNHYLVTGKMMTMFGSDVLPASSG